MENSATVHTYTKEKQIRCRLPVLGHAGSIWAVLDAEQARQLRQQLAAALESMREPVDHA